MRVGAALVGAFLLGLLGPTASFAQAPPKSCAGKFVGTWNHNAGFISNIATLTADGTAACSGNMFCVQGTWTCSGNSLSYNNGSSTTIYTLVSPNLMTGNGGQLQVTRIGAPPAGTDENVAKRGGRRCSDLSGIPGHAPGSQLCDEASDQALKDAKSFMTAARAAEQYCDYQDQMQAAGQYHNAADSFTKAGQATSARDAMRLAERASTNADRCEKKQASTKAAATAQPAAPAPSAQTASRCEAGLTYLSQVRMSPGVDPSGMQRDLRKAGCTVPEMRECLRDRMEGKTPRPGC